MSAAASSRPGGRDPSTQGMCCPSGAKLSQDTARASRCLGQGLPLRLKAAPHLTPLCFASFPIRADCSGFSYFTVAAFNSYFINSRAGNSSMRKGPALNERASQIRAPQSRQSVSPSGLLEPQIHKERTPKHPRQCTAPMHPVQTWGQPGPRRAGGSSTPPGPQGPMCKSTDQTQGPRHTACTHRSGPGRLSVMMEKGHESLSAGVPHRLRAITQDE